MTEPAKHKRLFGRSQGKKLSARQQRLIDERLPQLSWPDAGPIDPAVLLPGSARHVLEIGFGAAEHLIGQAKRAPDTGFFGVEPFLNGVAKALTGMEDAGLSNLRVKRADARDEIGRMPDTAFDQIYLLFPDPWHKARHAKRRFLQADTAAELTRLLKPGGRLRLATDVRSYADHAFPILLKQPGLSWTAKRAADWRDDPVDHIVTRYQMKHLGDIAPVFMDFVRI